MVKKILNSSTGATLLESVIAAAIIGINALGYIQLESRMAKERAVQRSFDAISNAGSLIRTVIRNRAVCTQTVRDNPLNQPFTTLSNATVDPQNLNNILPVNEPLIPNELGDGVALTEYQIMNDAGKYFIEATYAIDPDGNRDIGFQTIKRRYFINAKFDDVGNFQECKSEEKAQVESVSQMTCAGFLGGDPDQVTGECQPIGEDQQVNDPATTECGPGASYKLVQEGAQFKLECKPCIPETRFFQWKCQKGKEIGMRGVNWVNACYYRTVGCEGSIDTLDQTNKEMFVMQGPTKASGGDTGTKKNCKKKRRACPGERIPAEDAQEIAIENLALAEKYLEDLEKKYTEQYLVYQSQGNQDLLVATVADIIDRVNDVQAATTQVFNAAARVKNNQVVNNARDRAVVISNRARNIDQTVRN